MSTEATAANGSTEKATKAEHDTLRERVDELHNKVDFISDQVKLIGQAMDLLLAERGIERPDDE
jgi:tetrahydromethanopterin S-methyltransferase subunit G